MRSINRRRLAKSASSDMPVTSTRLSVSGRFSERELDDVYDELDDPREREGERRRRDMSSRERASIDARRDEQCGSDVDEGGFRRRRGGARVARDEDSRASDETRAGCMLCTMILNHDTSTLT